MNSMAPIAGLEAIVPGPTATPDGVIRHHEIDPAIVKGQWDGTVLAYVPPPVATVHPSLNMHDDFETEIDPITYQVLRYRLWNINLENSDTIKRASGNPIVCFADDFSTCILTESGDNIVGCPTIQYFLGQADLNIKYTLEKRSESPGIRDGDVFIQNDPYIGAVHQMDIGVYGPVFWEGRLFAWGFSAVHYYDIGGIQPGSYCFDAKDVFDEPLPWPPTKIVDQGIVRRDILDLFRRQSRFPDLSELQLRAQIAGLNTMRRRMLEILEEYGAATVKGVMRRMIRDASTAVSHRLMRIPDGEWEQVTTVTPIGGTDPRHLRMKLRKEGDRLIFSNKGTAPQSMGPGNTTFNCFRGAIACAANAFLAWDQLWCPAGVLNHLQFEPEPGTITTASYPAPVSISTYAPMFLCAQAGQVMSKMLLTAPPDLRQRATATGAAGTGSAVDTWGTDANGVDFQGMTADQMGGGFGAFPTSDGVDNGANYWWPSSNCGNVEDWESMIPMLYLYRRMQRGSGGPGKYRGGNGLERATIAHKAESFRSITRGNHLLVNTAYGLGGGYPGHNGSWLAAPDVDVAALLDSGRLPRDRAELEAFCGPLDMLPTNARVDLSANKGIFIWQIAGGGGYGDPLMRDPERVRRDVAENAITSAEAEEYGVVLTDGEVDSASTEQLRQQIRRERIARATAPASPRPEVLRSDQILRKDIGGLALGETHEGCVWACSCCGQVLSFADENFRNGAMRQQEAPNELNSVRYPDPSPFIDGGLIFRRWFCPSCGQLLAFDTSRTADPWIDDMRLKRDTQMMEKA